MRCIWRLSVKTEPLVKTGAIDAIRPKAGSNMETLDTRVSISSMARNCFFEHSFLYQLHTGLLHPGMGAAPMTAPDA